MYNYIKWWHLYTCILLWVTLFSLEMTSMLLANPLPETSNSKVPLNSVNATQHSSSSSSSSEHGISLIGWRWTEVSAFLVVSLFVLIAALVKLAYHHTSLQAHLPESCILVLLGTAFELLCTMCDIERSHLPVFSPNVFFFVLLPPVILESAYSLHDRIFFSNLGTVLLYAVVGTLMNIFLIAPILWYNGTISLFGFPPIPLIECLVFATLISAVDPVAVLAIFQEIGVNKALYFLVFGESLLNDAVVIVVYNCISVFASSPSLVTPKNVILSIFNFMTVSGGGLTIGMTWGVITCFLTKFTQHVSVLEPLIVLICAYLAYLTAELVHFSGIIGLIGCGIMQAEYSRLNISPRSYVTIKYITRNLSSVADVIIFFFLGQVLVRETHEWSTPFALIVTVLCVVIRFVSVFTLTYVANNWFHRVRLINLEEQLVMAYGGLRGAIAFSLSISINKHEVKHAGIFVSSTLFVILFTIFVLGSTTKIVVRLLRVRIEEKEDPKMFLFLNEKLIESLISGIEDVTGNRSYFHWMQKFSSFNDNRLKPILCKDWQNGSSRFTQTYKKVRHRSANKFSRDFSPSTAITSEVQLMDPLKSPTVESKGESIALKHLTRRVGSHKNRLNQHSQQQVSGQLHQLNRTRGPLTNSTTDDSIETSGQNGRWILVRNAVRFTSLLKKPTSPNSVVPLDSSQMRRTSNIQQSDQMNLVRRQLNSALSRTSFYQLPGSIFVLGDEADENNTSNEVLRNRGNNRRRSMSDN